jgi:hypothetical protein
VGASARTRLTGGDGVSANQGGVDRPGPADGARARRRSQNRCQSSVSGGRASWFRAQSERGGERVRLRAQVSGGKWESGARGSKVARSCGGGRRTHGRGRVHGEGRGQEVGDGLIGGLRGTERESGRTGTEKGADRTGPRGNGRERGSAGWRRHAVPVCQTPRARSRGRAHEAGPAGLKWVSIFRKFLMPFLFIFSRVFNSYSNQIKHVQQFKEYLELNMMQHFMTHNVLDKIK